MGRPPCCDKVGIKKGPWTPEEDIILVSYIQEHGPGNWRSVPTNTGLMRCSKSCRLRWTNYLRPGIKRGNFTHHEEGMIIHLQALLGNKWAAIASYLPQRTDNDIKNYWNTHLKKKLKKFQSALDHPHNMAAAANNSADHHNSSSTPTPHNHHHHHHQLLSSSKSFISERSSRSSSSLEFTTTSCSGGTGTGGAMMRSMNQTTTNTTYASSTENISRLLEGWMRSSPKSTNNKGPSPDHQETVGNGGLYSNSSRPKTEPRLQEGGDLMSHEEFNSILSFENLNNVTCSWDNKSTSTTCDDSGSKKDSENAYNNATADQDKEVEVDGAAAAEAAVTTERNKHQRSAAHENNSSASPPPQLSVLEKWLLDETSGQVVEEMMQLSPIF